MSLILGAIAKMILSSGVKNSIEDGLGIDTREIWQIKGFKSEQEYEDAKKRWAEEVKIKKQTFEVSFKEFHNLRSSILLACSSRGFEEGRSEKKSWEKFKKFYADLDKKFHNPKYKFFPSKDLAIYDVMTQFINKKEIYYQYQEGRKKWNQYNEFDGFDFIDNKIDERYQEIEKQNKILESAIEDNKEDQINFNERMKLLEEQKQLIEQQMELLKANSKEFKMDEFQGK